MGGHANLGVAIFCLMYSETKKANPLRKQSNGPEKGLRETTHSCVKVQ